MEVRDLTPKDMIDIENTQRISTMKLELIEKSLDVYFRMSQCSVAVRAELLAEVQPRIHDLISVRVQETLANSNAKDSYAMEETILRSRMIQIVRISKIADIMNKYYGSNWHQIYPKQYEVMAQELRLQGLGFPIF